MEIEILKKKFFNEIWIWFTWSCQLNWELHLMFKYQFKAEERATPVVPRKYTKVLFVSTSKRSKPFGEEMISKRNMSLLWGTILLIKPVTAAIWSEIGKKF